MFQKLQSKWKVSSGRLLLIIITFALGGSLCGYAGRKLLGLTSLDKGFLWVILYILLITVLWPLCVLIISIPLGQFSFFRRYLKRIFSRMSGRATVAETAVAVFASGAGSNAAKLIEQFNTTEAQKIKLVITNNPRAGVLEIAKKAGVPAEIIDLKNKTEEESTAAYLSLLEKYGISFIILAGYLKKIPAGVIKAYPQKIVNIHPALLPAYGGAGMYGMRVHEAVVAAQEPESGISIHYVDEIYDHGKIIAQYKCTLSADETPASLAQKIHALEHAHFGKTVAGLLS